MEEQQQEGAQRDAEPHGEAAQQEQPDYKSLWEQAKADSRKWEGRAKENKSKADAFDRAQDEAKSEAQRLTERAERAEAELQGLRDAQAREQWAREASRRTGVPSDVLRGSTKEEIDAHADELAALLAPRPPVVPTGEPIEVSTSSGDWVRDAIDSMKRK